MLRKSIYLLVLTIFLLNCTRVSPPNVEVRNITLATEQGVQTLATLYRPELGRKTACLLFVHEMGNHSDALQKFEMRIAQQGYAVFDLPCDDHCNIPQVLVAACKNLRPRPDVNADKIAVMGEGIAGPAVVQAVASDTIFAGVIALYSPLRAQDVDATDYVGKISPRPILVIAPDRDALVSKAESQRMYDLAGDPKKLVCLATKAHGIKILETDLEPVVRRVTLLFLEKYLKS